MDSSLQSQLDSYLHRLGHLKREGEELRGALGSSATERQTLALVGTWQRECAATISQLSGGSKAHWLSRAYSDAFLLSADTAAGIPDVSVIDIVTRILGVLDQAAASLTQSSAEAVAAASRQIPPAHRFEFVRDATLRAHLEQAYANSQTLYERGDFALAFVTSCSVLEAIVTEALERAGSKLAEAKLTGAVASWSLHERLVAAEKVGVISAACARLPESARHYRDLLDQDGDLRPSATVSGLEAKRVAQVLRIILRDLSPGR
jgi:hypothetical protein